MLVRLYFERYNIIFSDQRIILKNRKVEYLTAPLDTDMFASFIPIKRTLENIRVQVQIGISMGNKGNKQNKENLNKLKWKTKTKTKKKRPNWNENPRIGAE